MKISTSQYFTTMNNLMGDTQSKIAKTQSQLSVGKKNVTPSADIKATTASLKLNEVISGQEDEIALLKTVEARYQEEEGVLSSMTDMLIRMQELSIAASSDTYNASDLDVFAVEVEGYLADMRGLANSRDANGHYIFAGTKVKTQPFTTALDGSTVYNGNQTEPVLELETGYKLPLSTSGHRLGGTVERTVAGVTSKVGMFAVLTDFASALRGNDRDAVRTAISELKSVQENINTNLVDNGLRQNLVSQRQTIAEDKIVIYKGLLSNAQDVDYASSIAQLSSDMLALEAAQSTFAKVSQMSLFSYLR